MHHHSSLHVETRGRDTVELTDQIQRSVKDSGVQDGVCTVFVHHTSASLIVCENADRTVRLDLETFLSKIVPDGDPMFRHRSEGPDDMPAHVRAVLTLPSISIPVVAGRCDLGTWQGIYLWEHRQRPHSRRVTVMVVGE